MSKKIFFSIMLSLCSLTMLAQTRLILTTIDGTEHPYRIDATGGVYFSDSTLLIRENLADGANDYFAYAQVRKLTFETLNNISAGEPLGIALYPNPAQDYFTVSGVQGSARLQLFDSMGRKLLDQPVSNGQQVSSKSLAPGLYVASLDGKCIKFVKQ